MVMLHFEISIHASVLISGGLKHLGHYSIETAVQVSRVRIYVYILIKLVNSQHATTTIGVGPIFCQKGVQNQKMINQHPAAN